MPRLFTAVEIPRSIADRLSMLRSGLHGARWIDPENYHLTLRFIGDVGGETAREFTDALGQVLASPFELKLNGLGVLAAASPEPSSQASTHPRNSKRCNALMRARPAWPASAPRGVNSSLM